MENNLVPTKRRYLVVLLLFLGLAINYLDRTTLSIAAPVISKELDISPAMMGVMFSVFSFAYMIGQVPSGIILDRIGTRKCLGAALFLWSLVTMCFGFAKSASHFIALRGALGLAESPCIPSSQRAIASWFPKKERGLAVGLYISGQQLGLALFIPVLSWAVIVYGWHSIFFAVGLSGIIYALIWNKVYREPSESTAINDAEMAILREGGADIEGATKSRPFVWKDLGTLIMTRKLWGVFGTKFFFSATHSFYFTWFPHYLVVAKHMTLTKAGLMASIPYICAMLGITLGGFSSDYLSRKGVSHSAARKAPVIIGMLLCSSLLLANYVDDVATVMLIMSVAFCGQGIAGTIDALAVDIAPQEKFGTTIGLFQLFSNLGGMIAPIIIGFILQMTGSYNGALIFIAVLAILSIVTVAFGIGKVEPVKVQMATEK